MRPNKPVALKEKEEDFCETIGIIGLLISTACLLQHLYFMLPVWISFVFIAVYFLSIAAFFLLAKKSRYAFLLLCISGGAIVLLELFMMISLVFSLVVIVLLLFTAVVVALMATSNYPAKLKQLSIVKQMEEDHWAGKL